MDFLQYTKDNNSKAAIGQSNALSKYKELGVPTRKWETWKYTDLKTLLTSEFQKADQPSNQEAFKPEALDCFVVEFRNGFLVNQEIDSKDIIVQKLEETPASVLKSENPFDLLNMANGTNGLSLNITGEVEKPIIIAHRCDQNFQGKMNFVQNYINVKTNGKATIIELFIDNEVSSGFYNSLSIVNCEANSYLQHIKLVDDLNTDIDSKSAQHNFNSIHVDVARDAQFFSFAALLGGQKTRNDITVRINEPGAHVQVNGIYALDETQHAATYSIIDHLAAHTTSKQIYKGILQDKAHAVFNGRVIVRPDSQQISSDQINKNLLLSKASRIDTKPQLEIDADDVKCAHGATIGQLEPNEVFYLQTRGINEKMAKQLLAYAFVNEAVDTITNEAAKDHIAQYLKENLDRRNFLGKGQG